MFPSCVYNETWQPILKFHLSHKPPSSGRMLFWSGGIPRQSSRLKKFRDLVVPGGVWHKGIMLQVILTLTGVLTYGQPWLRIKGGVAVASVHAYIQRNNTYVMTARRNIYETRRPKHPHLPIHRYKWSPLGPPPCSRYKLLIVLFLVIEYW